MKILKPKSEFAHSVLTLMTGTTIAQAIPIAASPVITRLYSPEEFGVFVFFTTIVGFLSVILSGRYEQAIIFQKYEKYALNILVLSLILIVLTSTISFFLFWALKDEILSLFNNDVLGDWFYLVPVTALLLALFNLLISYNNRIGKYKDIAKATIIKSTALSIVQVSAGIYSSGFGGLVLGQIIAQVSANITLARNVYKNKGLKSIVNVNKIIALAKKHSDFPKYNLPHTLLNTISASLPIYYFSYYFGVEVVGYYSFGMMVSLTPIMIISNSIASVYNRDASEIYNSKGDVYQGTKKIILELVKKVSVPFIIFVFFSPEIFEFVFGGEWREAAVYLQILSFSYFLVFIVSVISYLPNLYNKQSAALYIEIVNITSKVLFISVGCVVFNDVYISLGLYALSSVLVLSFNLVWILSLTRNGR